MINKSEFVEYDTDVAEFVKGENSNNNFESERKFNDEEFNENEGVTISSAMRTRTPLALARVFFLMISRRANDAIILRL